MRNLFFRRVVIFDKLYDDIVHGFEYSELSGSEQSIIKGGLLREKCIKRAILINKPEEVSQECKNYTSYK